MSLILGLAIVVGIVFTGQDEKKDINTYKPTKYVCHNSKHIFDSKMFRYFLRVPPISLMGKDVPLITNHKLLRFSKMGT